MTSRDRILATLRGASPDRTPILVWPAGEHPESDAAIVPLADGPEPSERLRLAVVKGPYSLASSEGIDLGERLHSDPAAGGRELDRFAAHAIDAVDQAKLACFDGIWYELVGAHPDHCSPMRYGGSFLERDREILTRAREAGLAFLYVAGGDEAYLECVSDLPADLLVWEGENIERVRALRSGPICLNHPEADVRLIGSASIESESRIAAVGAHV